VEDAGGQGGIGLPCFEDFGEVGYCACSSAGNDRDTDGRTDGGGEFAVEAISHAVGVHGGEKDFTRASRLGFAGPLDDGAACIFATTMGKDCCASDWICSSRIAAGIDGYDDGLGSEAGAYLADEIGIGESGGVDTDLVGSGFEDGCCVFASPDAAAYGERDEEGQRGPANGIEERGAALMRRGDIEQDDLVSTLLCMAMSERGGIAGVNEIDELNAFDDTAVANVETSDDAAG